MHPPRPPYRGAVAAIATFALVIGLAQPALADQAATPAARIASLRGQAAKVRADIDRMNDQVEMVVEEYDSNHEALTRTKAAQARTRQRIAQAGRDLAAGRQQLDQRVWAVYTGGSRAGALAELLGATSLHEALTTEKYQAGVVSGDQDAVAKVEAARRGLQALAAELAGQLRAQRALQARLDQQHKQIEDQLAAQRAYLARLTVAVRRAVEQERQRQEILRRQALARRLAALRAARIRAERERAAARTRAAAGTMAATQVSQPQGAPPAARSGGTAAPARSPAQSRGAAASARSHGSAPAVSPAKASASRPAAAPTASAPPTKQAGKAAPLKRSPPARQHAPAAGHPKRKSKAAQAVGFALAQRGKPYKWAGNGPSSFDCSGLTQAAYRRAGLALPRVAAAQWHAGRHVDLGDLRRGDLVFFAYDLEDPSTIHHVGIYVGGGVMVEAPFTGANVRVSSIGRGDYIGAVRPAS